MPTVVLTQPVSGSTGGVPGTILTAVPIPFSLTTTADTCECGLGMSVKWIYTLMDATDETVVSGEVLAQHMFGNDVKWNWTGIVGDVGSMKHQAEVNLVSLGGGLSNLELQITNNDTGGHDWTANVVRIQVLGA